ncbi:hypothetical protein TTRE_0000217101 [Trichuris trichiura]|uniref:SH2 domain-containing protein n=1 Tax=Trichuris trichiura TaxID=36087 RepID=A0A077Z0E8_TRITR|nr:hypothetical protein TTRE_0000217101 [Trichuris trichiura]
MDKNDQSLGQRELNSTKRKPEGELFTLRNCEEVSETSDLIIHRMLFKDFEYDHPTRHCLNEWPSFTENTLGTTSREAISWNENFPCKEEEMLHDFAVRPLCKLPYYHGCNKLENLTYLPSTVGEYLLFLDSDAEYEVTLLVRDDEGILSSITIERNQNGHFMLHKSDSNYCFTTIDKLINHYYKGQIPIKVLKKLKARLRYPLIDPEFEKGLLIEETTNSQKWTNGDYLLSGDANDSSLKTVLVKWGDTYTAFRLEQNRDKKRWKLPRSQLDEPEETVTTVDQVLKSLTRIKDASCGFMLLQPVLVNSDANSVGDMSKPQDRSLRKLVHKGQKFTVYLDEGSKIVTLSLCLELNKSLKYAHVPIKWNEDGYFYIKPYDAQQRLSTIEELLEYYRMYHLPIEVNDKETAEVLCGYLTNEVLNLEYFKRFYAIEENDVTQMECFHKNLTKEEAYGKLNHNGDYLLRWDNQAKRTVISVFWDGHYYDIIVRPNETLWNGYPLPKADEREPTEYVLSLAEFIRSAVTCEFQFHEAVLRRPVSNRNSESPKKFLGRLS